MEKIKEIFKAYILWVWYYLYKPYREQRKVEAQKRIKICEECKYFWKPARNCIICGCFCDVKVKYPYKLDKTGISVNGCPERKW
jgi:hypothetical protein